MKYDRIHMTQCKPLRIRRREYMQTKNAFKPVGLWYGINNSWVDWCSSEMPEWVTPNRHKLEIDESKILKLSSISDMMKFNNKYLSKDPALTLFPHIEWHRVKSDGYTGIEIPTYHYQLRFADKFLWYYGWDVASGCIFDTRIITKVTKIRKNI